MNKKKGNISEALTLVVSLGCLVVITVYIINMIISFIWYQKLENIAGKYVHIIERFGYLTDEEEKCLYNDLKEEGFNIDNVQIDCPKSYLNYGTLFKFEIKYMLLQEYNIISNGIKEEARTIPLTIKKYSYSKI